MKGVRSREQLGRQVLCHQTVKQITCRKGEEPSPVASDPVCFPQHHFLGIGHVPGLMPGPGDAEKQSLPSTDSVQWGRQRKQRQ